MLTDEDWRVVHDDVGRLLTRNRTCRRAAELLGLDELRSRVLLRLVELDTDGRGYAEQRAPLRQWVVSVSVSVSKDALRRRARRLDIMAEAPAVGWVRCEAEQPTDGSMARMGALERQVIAYYVESGSVDAAAVAMGVPRRRARAMVARLRSGGM